MSRDRRRDLIGLVKTTKPSAAPMQWHREHSIDVRWQSLALPAKQLRQCRSIEEAPLELECLDRGINWKLIGNWSNVIFERRRYGRWRRLDTRQVSVATGTQIQLRLPCSGAAEYATQRHDRIVESAQQHRAIVNHSSGPAPSLFHRCFAKKA